MSVEQLNGRPDAPNFGTYVDAITHAHTPDQVGRLLERLDASLRSAEAVTPNGANDLRKAVEHQNYDQEMLNDLRASIDELFATIELEEAEPVQPEYQPVYTSLEEAGIAETYIQLRQSSSERHNRQLGESGQEVTAYKVDNLVLRIPNVYDHENSKRATKSTAKRAEALQRGKDIDGLEQLRVHDRERNIIATEYVDGVEFHKISPKDITTLVETGGLTKLHETYATMNERGIATDEVPDNFLLDSQGLRIIDYKTTKTEKTPEEQMLTFANKTLYYAIREQAPAEREAWRDAATEALRLAQPKKVRSPKAIWQSVKHLTTRRKLNKLFQ